MRVLVIPKPRDRGCLEDIKQLHKQSTRRQQRLKGNVFRWVSATYPFGRNILALYMYADDPPDDNIRVAHKMRPGRLRPVEVVGHTYNAVHAALEGDGAVGHARRSHQPRRCLGDVALLKLIAVGLEGRGVDSFAESVARRGLVSRLFRYRA